MSGRLADCRRRWPRPVPSAPTATTSRSAAAGPSSAVTRDGGSPGRLGRLQRRRAARATRRGRRRRVPGAAPTAGRHRRGLPRRLLPLRRRRDQGVLRELQGVGSNPTSSSPTTRDDLHQDHRAASASSTWNTFRDHLILEYEIPKCDGDLGRPNVYVQLESEHVERKVESIWTRLRAASAKSTGSRRKRSWRSCACAESSARRRAATPRRSTAASSCFYEAPERSRCRHGGSRSDYLRSRRRARSDGGEADPDHGRGGISRLRDGPGDPARESRRRPRLRFRVTVYDNYVRGVPVWLESAPGRRPSDARRTRHREPLPEDIDDFEYVVHAAGIASPTYYRRHPIETMDANMNGLRSLLDWALRQGERGRPIEGFLFFSSSEIYGDPTPENHSDPRDLSRQRILHRPARLLRRIQALRRDPVRELRAEHDLPVKMARPFNNYGPGIEDHRPARDCPTSLATFLTAEDIVMLSDGAPKRTFCYVADAVRAITRCWSAAATASLTTWAWRRPRSR